MLSRAGEYTPSNKYRFFYAVLLQKNQFSIQKIRFNSLADPVGEPLFEPSNGKLHRKFSIPEKPKTWQKSDAQSTGKRKNRREENRMEEESIRSLSFDAVRVDNGGIGDSDDG